MHQPIPPRHSCDGEDVNPALAIDGVAAGAKSLALIVNDPDAPAKAWVLWTLWNIHPDVRTIGEDSVPAGAVQGRNDFG